MHGVGAGRAEAAIISYLGGSGGGLAVLNQPVRIHQALSGIHRAAQEEVHCVESSEV